MVSGQNSRLDADFEVIRKNFEAKDSVLTMPLPVVSSSTVR